MANGGNRPIAPVRKLVGAVLGTVATFVVLFGLGMTSWAIVALGVALLVLAIALATVRAGGRTWVIGEGHVHSVSEPPTQYAFGRCELQLVIDAPGLPPRSKKIIDPRVPVAKWPAPGQTLPIRVALDDQRHVRVLWDEVPTHAETAAVIADLPPEYADTEPVEEVLIRQEAPPWADRTPEDDFRDPYGDPYASPSVDPVAPPAERETVVVHQVPGGPKVVEGTLVEPPSSDLPRRASTPTPRPPADEALDPLGGTRFDPPADRYEPVVDAPRTGEPYSPPADAPEPPPARGFRVPSPADPLDPLDLPLDDPPAPRADEAVPPDGLDEAIFGEAAGDPPIAGVGLTLLVTDLSRSLAFYRDLGFTEVDRGSGNAVLASGSTRLVLREVTEAAPISRRLVHVNLEVDDIEAAYARLRESGVRFTYAPRVVNRGTKLEVWAAAFRDPDGHGIALTQWRERADA
ncbi:VOC family protein [Micromonospora sp. NPDC047707]|uniref:VOC family protein n=1 Tax=Micromonospora sp. NPDC047707 TaxID=3154498 RepID=UPI0034539499